MAQKAPTESTADPIQDVPTPPAPAAAITTQSQHTRRDDKPIAITAYLILYNFISAILWSVVFGRVVTVLAIRGLSGYPLVYYTVGNWTKWTQTLAALEVLHAALGFVRASPFTTFIQVTSRFLLVWGAVHFYPIIATSSFAYSTMLLAWSTTEVIRYTYFALQLSGAEGDVLKWLRYSTFVVLYPVGISSELWELFRAGSIAFVEDNKLATGLVVAAMLPYVYFGPYLYTHMLSQRRKILGGGGGRSKKVQ